MSQIANWTEFVNQSNPSTSSPCRPVDFAFAACKKGLPPRPGQGAGVATPNEQAYCCVPSASQHQWRVLQGDPRLVSQVNHPFFRTYVGAAGCPFTWWMGNVVGLIFWKKILKFFIWSGSGPGTRPAWFSGSAWFWAWSSSLRVFNFLAWKPLHMVNLT